jgi:tetratricopeptide (TPR) repeat protein
MLTSRNDECHQYATEKYIALDGLAEAEAQGLLLRAAHVPHDQHWALKDDAQKVASLLRSHPLALIQAGSYVARGHCTLAEYPLVYVQQRKRLLTFRTNQARSRYRDVYATFEASAEILQSSRTELSGDALQLLPVLAICGPSRLPLPLFEAAWRSAQTISPSKAGTNDADRLTPWHVSRLPSFIQIDTDIWDSFRLIEAIHLLKSFSLVSTDTYNGFLSVSMHPLIHAWARDRLDPAEQHESWVTTGCLVAVSSSGHVLWRKHGWQLQPHLQALLSWEISRMFTSEPPVMITCILVKCGWLLYKMRDDAKLFVLMNKLITYLSLNRLTVDEKWLPVYDLTARNLVNYGKVREAVSLLEQVVKIKEQTLAEGHTSRLASQHVLAIAYQANGQVKEAVSLLEQVVKIKEYTRAEDRPDRLASQHVLAIAYRANGQVKEAVSLLEQVVKIREQTLAEDHPSRLASQHELAGAYQANGQVKDAVSLLEQVVKIEEQTLAEDHPSRLASQHELAGAYQANGQVKEAVSLLEQVVKIEERTLAEDHPSRLASQHELAGAYEANGQVKEAVSLLERVAKIEEQTLAEDHPDRLTSQHELARAYKANGQVKEAVSLLEHVVKIGERTLTEDHPDRLASQHALAIAYRANGRVKEAVSLLEQVVKIEEQTLAEDHPSRLASQNVLATIFWGLGRRNASLQIMKHVVEIQRQALDKHHPDRRNSEAWLEYFEDEICNVEAA